MDLLVGVHQDVSMIFEDSRDSIKLVVSMCWFCLFEGMIPARGPTRAICLCISGLCKFRQVEASRLTPRNPGLHGQQGESRQVGFEVLDSMARQVGRHLEILDSMANSIGQIRIPQAQRLLGDYKLEATHKTTKKTETRKTRKHE